MLIISYCRWSTDDFQCDVYVFESDQGFETHVAGNRTIYKDPLPEHVPFDSEHVTEWVERQRIIMGMVETAEREYIDLPEVGASFTHQTPGECAANLIRLRALGYRVPQDAIDDLLIEQREGPS